MMEAPPSAPNAMPAPPDAKPTVILVYDDAALRTALKFSLELDGFEVTAFESGEDLLRGVLPRQGGCLVLDQNLPGLSGLEALSILRSRANRLPALLITSHPGPGLREAALRANAVIVEKPLIGDALVGCIQDLLDQARSARP